MPTTRQQALDIANPNDLPSLLRGIYDGTNSLGLGAILAAMRPRNRSRTGLTSSATQVHDEAALIVSVEATQGTPLAIITGGSPDAGEVSVDYNATTGIPTLTFNAATTSYYTTQLGPIPQDLSTTMAASL